MDISHLMIHSQQIEEENLEEKSGQSKRARTSDGDFLILGVSNHNTHGGTGNGSSNPACQRNCKKAQPSGSGSGAPRQNKFYALQTRQDHEGSQNVVTSMLKVFHFDVYDLLDLGATFPFVTPYVAMRFDVGHVILSNPFYVPTPIDDSIIA
ncbi:uncharacterized protein LOC125869676 [Solanum stenotomum]|uniref:uncharacterized protein LOC125869676 n=1 Tax=Solanum stenotomum TaxID=172797 RepID=UPI0020D1C7C1|nr:uncharacterized protein LOC125869676 [Solanum stenotomum]